MSESLKLQTVREHYKRITPVMKELAYVDSHPTIGLNDYSGWYVRRNQNNFDLLEEGYEQEGRCATLATDYEIVRKRIDRALYVLTTYKSKKSLMDWEPCTFEDGSGVWKNEKPTPGYGDLRGVMVWGDIDLADHLKPQRGSIDDETQQTIEATLEAYIEEYARLYGDRDAIFALDSVGGSYVMGAPAATLPIAEIFDEDADARERVMEALVNRSNKWLKDAQQRVEKRVDGAAEVIDPDWVNNCNRQYKAPLSLHTDHDAVVVPLDTDAPKYELVRFQNVTDDLVESTANWAAKLTSTEYRDRAETLVKRLWPDEYETTQSWKGALAAWVEAEREREEQQEEARQRARQRRRERKEQMGGGLERAPVTPFIEDVFDAVDALDIEDVADRTIVHQWTDSASGKRDNSGDRKRAFVPVWGPNAESGNANFVDTDKGLWIDTGDDHSGGPVKMALIAEENWSRGETPSGEDRRRGLEYLREMGFEIPVWTPDAHSQNADGEEYDVMPYWAVRKAAVALDAFPEDGFIRKQGQYGEFLAFPGSESENLALAAIEDAGLEHGREYKTGDGTRPDDLEETSNTTNTDAPPAPTPDSQHDQNAAIRDSDGGAGETSPSGNFGAYSELDVQSGGYGYWHTNRETGDTWFEPVTNFTIEVESFLFNEGERLIDMSVIPATGEKEYELTVPTKVFNDARRFRDSVVIGLSTTFDGASSDLNELRKLVSSQDAPIRTGTHHMGLHPDAGEFVTPKGVLTADGWIEDPQMAYIEREIGAERAWSLTPEKNNEYDAEHVLEILELVPKSRFSERFLPALGWLYTAPLRPYIQEWEGQFNTLHVTGETGAGKSSTLSVLWKLLGMNGEPMACDDTKFALLTSMASTNSIPMWYDEYKPGDMKDWEVDRFQNLMRSTTRGGVATRGNADKSTEEYELKAPLMISGEQSIQGPAEVRRSIQTRFREGVKEPGSPTKAAFAHLTGMAYDAGGKTREPDGCDLEQHALAYYQFVLGQEAEQLKELWRNSRDYVRDLLTTNDITGVDDLPRQGVQTVHFGMTLYQEFVESMANEADIEINNLDLTSGEQLNEALLYIAKQFGDGGSRKSHLDGFIELVSRAATEEYLEEGKHFTFVNEDQSDEQLALKLSSVHDRVSKYVRDHNLESADLLNSASDYRDRMDEVADDHDSYVITHSQYTPPLNRCARINTEIAEDQIEFSRLAFGADPRDSHNEEEEPPEKEEKSVFDSVPIDRAAESLTGYVTVTAEIVTSHRLPGDGRGVKAVLKDCSSPIKIVTWDDDLADNLEDLEGQTVAIIDAEVGEYDGTRQLETVEGLTTIKPIQRGVGYTTGVAPDVDQDSLTAASEAAETDGGSDQLEARVLEWLRTQTGSGDSLSVPSIAGELGVPPSKVERVLDRISQTRSVIESRGDGEFTVL